MKLTPEQVAAVDDTLDALREMHTVTNHTIEADAGGRKLLGAKPRERDIERYLVQRVKALGGEVRKVQWVGRRGAPDRLVMLPRDWHPVRIKPAMSIWIELKAPGVKPKAYQLREHERMRAMGQRVVVIDSIEAVERLLA